MLDLKKPKIAKWEAKKVPKLKVGDRVIIKKKYYNVIAKI